MVSWFVTSISTQGSRILNTADIALKYPRPTLPPYMMPIEPQSLSLPDILIPVIAGAAAVVSLLLIDRMAVRRMNLHRKKTATKNSL